MMRRILILLLVFPLIFGTCSKDDEPNNDNAEIQVSAWSKDDSIFKNDILSFGVGGKGHYAYTTTTSNPQFRSYELTYVYNKPNIVIKFKDGSNFGSGYIEGNKIYIEGKGVFTRYS